MFDGFFPTTEGSVWGAGGVLHSPQNHQAVNESNRIHRTSTTAKISLMSKAT